MRVNNTVPSVAIVWSSILLAEPQNTGVEVKYEVPYDE